ncbi:MAG: type I-E CRISPR-associated protein Cse2/CasB [Blastocatellia bacterium]
MSKRENFEARYEPDPDEKRNVRKFVEYLECLAGLTEKTDQENEERSKDNQSPEGRAALARLRRTLGKDPDRTIRAYPYVVRWTQNLDAQFDKRAFNKTQHVQYEWQVSCYYHVASLFAYYHKRRSWHHAADLRLPERNFGASLRRLDEKLSKQDNTEKRAEEPERSKSLEKRITALLMSRRSDLPKRLRYAVARLKDEEIPIDWVQLLEDLKWWDEDYSRRSSSNPIPSVQRRWANSFWRVTPFDAEKATAGKVPDATTPTQDKEEDQ